MSTKRQIIDSLRQKLRERNADSDYSNQFLYQTIMEQAKWIIRREVSSGKIYKNVSLFQTLSCFGVIESSVIDKCCPIKTNCKIYRTECKLPELWIEDNGPILKGITSVDGSTDFFYTNPTTWNSKKKDPYQSGRGIKYVFYADGHLWFPEFNPNLINVEGFYVDDLEDNCNPKRDCVRFLDTKFNIPEWVEAEILAKAIDLLARVTKRLPVDQQIDKNETRKN